MGSITDAIIYFISSVIEFSGLCILTLSLFRLGIRLHIREMILSSVLCSFVSIALLYFNIHGQALILQMLAYILCFFFIFGVPITKSLVVGSFGYTIYLLIQQIYFTILSTYELIKISEIVPDSPLSRILQFSTIAITLIISFFIYRANEGFGYLSVLIFKNNNTRGNSSKSTIFNIASLVLIALVSISIGVFSVYSQLIFFFLILLVLIVVCSIMTVYLIKRDSRQFKQFKIRK